MAAPLPAYAQDPLVTSEEAGEGERSATSTKAHRSEAPSRDQPSVETSPSPQASAQRLAQLDVVAPSGSADEPAPTASADPGDTPPKRDASDGARRKAPREGGRKISLEDDFVIEGKLEKPSAYYILRRSTLDYDWARLDARFSPLVLESVQDPLF